MSTSRTYRRTLVVGTRASALAMVQTEWVMERLGSLHPALNMEIRHVHTGGDRDQHSPLTEIGGQGIFVKEIENALLARSIDLAVHSLKDMPTVQPEGLTLAAVLPRADARDALVSRLGLPLAELPAGARVGTGSLRRQAQLRALRPDLEVVGLRGNVDTRLRKARSEMYDAVLLAVAGLARLNRAGEITQILPADIMLPAVGQGAICVEARLEDADALALVRGLDDPAARSTTAAERAFLRELGGGCHVPIAAYAELAAGELWLRGLVADESGSRMIRGEIRGPQDAADLLGKSLARRLLVEGAEDLLEDGACTT